MSRFTYAWETSRTPTEDEQARLVATRFVPGRFQGRTALERAARRGDVVALARLEVKLGLADKSAVTAAYEALIQGWLEMATDDTVNQPWRYAIDKIQRLAQVPKGNRLPLLASLLARKELLSAKCFAPPEVIENIEKKQRERKGYKLKPVEPAYARLALRRLDDAEQLARIKYRRTQHHTREVKIVPPGEERVTSESHGFWPASGSGKRFQERASEHEWYISSEILRASTRKLQEQNRWHVYLTPEKRVRSGRGSALVTEILNKTRQRPRWIKR